MNTKQTELRVKTLDFMDELSGVIVGLYESIRDYDLSGIETLSDITDALVGLAETVVVLDTELELGLENAVKNIYSQLRELENALVDNDFLFISDVLEFDILENMEVIYNAVRDK